MKLINKKYAILVWSISHCGVHKCSVFRRFQTDIGYYFSRFSLGMYMFDIFAIKGNKLHVAKHWFVSHLIFMKFTHFFFLTHNFSLLFSLVKLFLTLYQSLPSPYHAMAGPSGTSQMLYKIAPKKYGALLVKKSEINYFQKGPVMV